MLRAMNMNRAGHALVKVRIESRQLITGNKNMMNIIALKNMP